jgi:hypothetical protein
VRNELGRWKSIGGMQRAETNKAFYDNNPALVQSWGRKFISIAVECGCLPDSVHAQELMQGMTTEEREQDIVRRSRDVRAD